MSKFLTTEALFHLTYVLHLLMTLMILGIHDDVFLGCFDCVEAA